MKKLLLPVSIVAFGLVSAQNTGIGTTAPTSTLDVVGTSSPQFKLRSKATGQRQFWLTVDDTKGVVDYKSTYFDTGVYPHTWSLGNDEFMRLNTTGLGLGITVPEQRLDVNGNALVRGNLMLRNANTTHSIFNYPDSATNNPLYLGTGKNKDGTKNSIILYNLSCDGGCNVPQIQLLADRTTTGGMLSVSNIPAASGGESVIVAGADGVIKQTPASALTSATEPWYNEETNVPATANNQSIYQKGDIAIADNGNLNAPGNKLYFGRGQENTDPLYMYRYNGALDKSDLRVNIGDNDGVENSNTDNFVIGNGVTPANFIEKFSISGSTGQTKIGSGPAGTQGIFQILPNQTSPISTRLLYGTDDTGWKFSIGKNKAGTITDQFVIQDNGNVGIGTTTPTQKLVVNGAYAVVNGLGDEQAYLGGDGGGNDVQIGSLNPAITELTAFNPGSGLMNFTSKNVNSNGQLSVAGQTYLGTVTAGSATDNVIVRGNDGFLKQVPAADLAAANAKNIYNADGTLTGGRTVTMAGNTLHFAGGPVMMTNEGSSLSLVGTTHNYINYYPQGVAAGRKGYAGFATSGTNDYSIGVDTPGAAINLNSANTHNSGSMDVQNLIRMNWNADATNGIGIASTGAGGGGWSRGYNFTNAAGTVRLAGFGAVGGPDSLDNLWIGKNYDNNVATFNINNNLSTFNGQVKINNIPDATTADQVLVTDGSGLVQKKSTASLASSAEPWYIQGTNTPATANNQSIYQTGNVMAQGALQSSMATNEGGVLQLLNPNKTGATASTWSIYNMTGGYNNGLNFWRYYADGTNAGPAVTFLDNGNVGIGTSSPSNKLHVNGAYALIQGLGDEQAYIGGDGGGNDVQVGSLNPNVNLVSIYGASGMMNLAAKNVDVTGRLYVGDVQPGSTSDNLLTRDGNGIVKSIPTSAVSSASEPWRVEGTTTPATSNAQNIYQSGNVGIGTSDVTANLDIAAASSPMMKLRSKANGLRQLWVTVDDSKGIVNYQSTYYTAGVYPQVWSLGNDEYMRLNTAGLGIGTNAPESKLDVNGDALVRGTLRVRDANATHSIFSYPEATNNNPFYLGAGKNPDGSKNRIILYNLGCDGGCNVPLISLFADKTEMSGTATIGNIPAGANSDAILVADVAGNVKKVAASTIINANSQNIYNTDGTLTDPRTVTQAGKLLKFTGGDVIVANSSINNAGSIELNQFNAGDRNTFIDFHSAQASGVGDYEARIIRGPGVNGNFDINNTGTGLIQLSGNSKVIGDLTVSGTIYQTSDAKFKKDVQTLKGGLSTISSLRPVTYTWNDAGVKHGGEANKEQIGFIAQEIEKVLPSAVQTDKDGNKSVNYSQVIPVLTQSVQELKKENEDLKKRLEKIETLLNDRK